MRTERWTLIPETGEVVSDDEHGNRRRVCRTELDFYTDRSTFGGAHADSRPMVEGRKRCERDGVLIASASDLLAAAKAAERMINQSFTESVRKQIPEWYDVASRLADAIAAAEGGEA